MKHTILRLIALVLVISTVFAPIPVSAANELSYLEVACVSNLCDMNLLTVLLRNNQPCISVADAAALSGYERVGAYFVRAGERVDPDGFSYDDTEWIYLESGLEALNTEVVQIGSVLIIRGLETTANECFEQTDEIMNEFYHAYRVVDTLGAVGTWGYVSASIYNIVSQGKFFSHISGNYTEDLYKKVVEELIDSEEDEGLLTAVVEGDKIVDKLEKISKIEGIGAKWEDEQWKIVYNNPSTDFYITTKTVKILSDPLGQLLEHLGFGFEIDETFYTLEGLDAASQIKLYQYFDNLVSCGSLYANMFCYTYGIVDLKHDDYYVQEFAAEAISDLIDYYNSENFWEMYGNYLGAELELIGVSTMDKFMDGAILNHLLLSSPASKVVPLVQFALRESFDFFMDDVSEKMDYIEESRCLTDLQTGIMKLYREYRKKPETAINAKYAAMLYIRCGQVNRRMALKAGFIDKSYDNDSFYEKKLKSLATISDRDLTVKVSNKRITIPEEEVPVKENTEAVIEKETTAVETTEPTVETTVPTEETTAPYNSNWYDLTALESVWKCANFIEGQLRNDPQVYDARILVSEQINVVYGEGYSVDWAIDGTDAMLTINDNWLDDNHLLALVSATEYTISIRIGPTDAPGGDIVWGYDPANWWDSMYWVYDWNGNLINRGVDMDLAEGLFYAIDQS